MADAIRIDTPGLRELMRDLRSMGDRDGPKAVRSGLREGARVVSTAARPKAPVRSGKLAASYRPGASGTKAFVRSRLPYAAIHEFGGTITPRGTPIEIRASRPIHAAFDDTSDDVVNVIGDEFEKAARRLGWR